MAVIQVNGYRHGLLRVAHAVGDAAGVTVADIDAGRALRQAGHRKPIWLLTSFHTPAELGAGVHHDLTVVVHSCLATIRAGLYRRWLGRDHLRLRCTQPITTAMHCAPARCPAARSCDGAQHKSRRHHPGFSLRYTR